MTIRERGEGVEHALTKTEYDALDRSDPRPWPEPVAHFLAALRDAPDESWRERAACHPDNRDRPVDQWVEMWFPDNGGTYVEARAICGTCPVKAECRDDGNLELFGMWGGADTETRIRERSGGLPPMTRHGYAFGAQAHRRRGEKPCAECLEVQHQYDRAYRARRKAVA